jgi:hypothetical protein
MTNVKKSENRKIIKTLTLKRKVKHHFRKQNDCITKGNKQQSTFSFSFFASKFLSFFVFRMNVEEIFVEKLQKQSKKRLQKLRKEK